MATNVTSVPFAPVVPGSVLPQGDEHLLHCVLGVRGNRQEAASKGPDQASVLVNAQLDRRHVSGSDALEQR